MIDFLLGIYLAGLAVRGWLRGLVKEAVDLAGMVLGVVVAFRVSAPVGDFLSNRFGVSPEAGRIGAAIALFLLVGVGLSVAAHYLTKLMRLPGLNLSNRLLGAVLAGLWGALIALAMITIAQAVSSPSVDDALDDSVVVEKIAGPEALPRRMFFALAGDGVLSSISALERLVGGDRLVLDADDSVEIPPAESSELEVVPERALELFALVNIARVDAGVAPMVWSDGLAAVGEAHAFEMYQMGYVSHVSPVTGTVADRVAAAGIPLVRIGENIGLASSVAAVHAGLMESDGHRSNIESASFDRVGIGLVQGPLGTMAVQVFGG